MSDPQTDPIRHRAACDICKFHILGDRYKCFTCPDYDICSSCFGATEVQHPGHNFARLRQKEDFIRRSKPPKPHRAECNVCTKTIHGTRFKCIHPDCPNFDLCASCEARPIPTHPETHPLLKIKKPNAPILQTDQSGSLAAVGIEVAGSVTNNLLSILLNQ